MPAIKRSASSSPSLIAHKSLYHSSVTLFTDAEPSTALSPPPQRRSKRLKTEYTPVSSQIDSKSEPVSRPKRKVTKTVASPVETVKDEVLADQDANPAKRKRSTSPRKPKLIVQSLEVPHPPPAQWREVYYTIRDMRSRIAAPVDTMGCDQAHLKEEEPKNQRFATLVSLMLSSQTKDEVTDAAVSKLRTAIGGSLTVSSMLAADEDAISEAINKVGFWRRKTQYLRQTAQRLRDEFDSDVPKTVDELCSLPGVGPKMAFLTLQVAWNLNVGIGVDVHVHRITNRLGWHKPPTKNPEETRLNLQSWLPKEFHREINHMLVGFGQTICIPVGPKCNECQLSDGLCPSARKEVKSKGKKVTTSVSSVSGPKIEIKLEVKEEPTSAEYLRTTTQS